MKKNIKTIEQLLQENLINNSEYPLIKKVTEQFSVSIPSNIVSTIQEEVKHNQHKKKSKRSDQFDEPLYKQFVPSSAELNIQKIELNDPIGDGMHEVVPGLIHRYPDRCLLLPLKACPIYCRFCFRREYVAKHQPALDKNGLKKAFDYIADHAEIWEVILTGGDPLFLKPKTLRTIFKALNEISHVEVIRIHTRIPLIEPDRINDELIEILKSSKTIYVSLHANHPNEFTDEGIVACAKLVGSGIPMISQTVLLKGINNNIETLANLMKMFVKNRIKPYYIHQADLAKGTSHFRTTLEEGQQLMQSLRGYYSGLCQPIYVLDIPGGFGKVPICKEYVEALAKNVYTVKDYQGKVHDYSSGI